jgi:hypothetical protein
MAENSFASMLLLIDILLSKSVEEKELIAVHILLAC